MSDFESFEARVAAENAAIKQLLDFANTEPQYTQDVATFNTLTGRIKDLLALSVQGIARLCPETAMMSYEAKASEPPHAKALTQIPGPAAYDLFIHRHKRFQPGYFEGGSVPYIEVAPTKGSLIVHANYVPAEVGEEFGVGVETDDSAGLQVVEGSSELHSSGATFSFLSNTDFRSLTLSKKDNDPVFLDGRPTTEPEVAVSLYDGSMATALEQAGLYGLGSYLLWRSVRNLGDVTELPPNAI